MRKYIYASLALSTLLIGCKDKDSGLTPTDIDANTITATAYEGAVTLKWAVPDAANYYYIAVDYVNPETKKPMRQLASIHSDSARIENLFARYGAIEYSLTPYTKDGNSGTTRKITSTCLPVPEVKRVVADSQTQLALTADGMWTDSHQVGDGDGLPALIDNNPATYWHIKWSPSTPFPHYLVVKLPEDLGSALSFYWKGRNNANKQNPKTIEVYGSNTAFAGATNEPEGFAEANYPDLELISTFSGMPGDQAAEYTSPAVILKKSYRYIWFKITEGHNSSAWSAVAEWKVFKHKVEVHNPETGKTTQM